MKNISSRSNPLFKFLYRLATSARTRRHEKKTLIEGIHLIEEWTQRSPSNLMIYIAEDAKNHPEVRSLLNKVSSVAVFSRALFDEISPVKHSVGILGVVDIPTSPPASHFTHAKDALWIDNVQDTGNIGTILRTAAGAGIDQILMTQSVDTAWSPKCLRAAMGAHLSLRFYEATALMPQLINHPYILATTGQASTSLFDIDLTLPTLWIVGNEGQGINAQTSALATHQVSIPLTSSIESLNVGVATAICLFEQVRQRRCCHL